jgi:hypothetical protein
VPLREILPDLERLVYENDAVMMFWYPYTDKAWMKYWNAAPGQKIDFGWWQRTTGKISQYVGRKLLGGPLEWALHHVPQLTPLSMKAALRFTRESTYIEGAADAFHFEYVNPLLWDACYAIPMDQATAAWQGLMSLIEEFRARGRYPINMVTTSRFTRASTSTLSPAYGRDTCFLEAITSKGTPHIGEFYRAFEDLMMHEFDGRPHWAKVFYHISEVRGVYEKRLAEFEEVRERWDPEGIFLNPFLSEVMGLTPSELVDWERTTNP